MSAVNHAILGSEYETPAFVPFKDDHMFGILTTPSGTPRRIGVLLANGAGVVPCCGRNQFWTTLARQLGAAGFHVLRFDYPGAGDSPGVMRAPDFNNPLADEVTAAFTWLRREVDEVAIIGKCFGGRNAVYAAPQLDGLRGIAMVSTPVTPEMKADNRVRNTSLRTYAGKSMDIENLRRYLGDDRRIYARLAVRRLRAAARTVVVRADGANRLRTPASRFFDRLDPVLKRGASALVLSGTDDAYFADLDRELREGKLAELLAQYGAPQVMVEVIEGRVHGFGRIDVQDRVRDVLRSWVIDVVDTVR